MTNRHILNTVRGKDAMQEQKNGRGYGYVNILKQIDAGTLANPASGCFRKYVCNMLPEQIITNR